MLKLLDHMSMLHLACCMITAPKKQHAGLSAELWVDLCNTVMQFGLGPALDKHLWPGMLWLKLVARF